MTATACRVDRRLLDFEGRPLLQAGSDAALLLKDLIQRGGKITTTVAKVNEDALRKLVLARLVKSIFPAPNLVTYEATELGHIAVRDLPL
jgi:hypothetical protein